MTIPVPLAKRFWAKVDVRGPDECWLWKASGDSSGYGRIWGEGGRAGRELPAHRVAYELLVGPIPDGLELDHLCRNRGCVNPTHLDPVTQRENILRGSGFAARNARKTHCKYGHPFDEANTYFRRDQGRRVCRACRDIRYYEWRRRQAASRSLRSVG